MKDMYVEEPERLQGKPKRTIADYAESNGFLVPRRFGSLREARESKLPILVRSEHPQEYGGVSGLLKSFDLETLPDTSDEGVLKEAVLDRLIEDKYKNPLSKKFCKLTGQNESDFERDVSFSLWERLEGINRTMVADSSISGRYHIMTCKFGEKEKIGVYSYLLFEDGKASQEFIGDLPEDLQRGLPSLI